MQCSRCNHEHDFTFCPECGEANKEHMIPDLFGELRPVKEFLNEEDRMRNESKYQEFKRSNHYRRADGYNRCKFCKHHFAMHYHDKVYHKCKLLGVSNSEATDIRVRNVCDLFANYMDSDYSIRFNKQGD